MFSHLTFYAVALTCGTCAPLHRMRISRGTPDRKSDQTVVDKPGQVQ